MSEIPWLRIMRLGMGMLRLPPEDFWSMTPPELVAAFEMENHTPLGRNEMEELISEESRKGRS